MSSRKQSFVAHACPLFEVLFDGATLCWKTRSNLDILIASHSKQLCIELVAYNAEIGVEAPRIYISSMLLATKIDPTGDDFQEKLSAKKEVLNRQKKTCNTADLTKQLYNEFMVKYILQRLNPVTEDIDLTTECRILLTVMSEDTVSEEDDTRLDIICEMPPDLVPVEHTHTKKHRWAYEYMST
jgi:hypothetical protein